MAEMIPDRLPASASPGERRVFALLQKLDADCLVYYEPVVGGRYPDFLVIIPDLELLVIEVKGWRLGSLRRADRHNVVVRENGVERPYPHPVRQARGYMNKLRDACRASRYAGHLTDSSGRYAGRFIFPFGHVAILNSIKRSQLAESGHDVLAEIFSPDRTITRDQLEIWETLDGANLRTELAKRFDPWWHFPRLTQFQVNVLRSMVHPAVIIADGPGDFDLKVLDLRQERHALSIGEGHRVLYGVAGSGKTVILVARAKLLAQDPAKRILVLCFNKVLAKYFAGCLADQSNIEVRHFHGWGTRNGIRFAEGEDFEEYGGRFLRRLQSEDSHAGRYDAVLIDEAQDFACSWFHCAKTALKRPDEGALLVVGDGSQAVYRKRAFNWADAGIHALGRTINRKFDLDKNYRNTVQIIAAAQSFAEEETPVSSDAAIRSLRIDPSAAMRRGPWPIVMRKPDRRSEISAATELIRSWLSKGVEIGDAKVRLNSSDVGVLYPQRQDNDAIQRLQTELSEFAPVVLLAGKEANGDPFDVGVKITTIHSAKGLQFRAAVLIWADLLPSQRPDRREAEERSLFYVALTRAEDVLVVTHSRSSRYVDELQRGIASASQTLKTDKGGQFARF